MELHDGDQRVESDDEGTITLSEPVEAAAASVEPVPSPGREAERQERGGDGMWVRQWDAAASAFFYFNPRTQETTWDRPAGYVDTVFADGPDEEDAAAGDTQGDAQRVQLDATVKIQSVYRGHSVRSRQQQEQQRQWVEQFDPATGKRYYYNVSTGASQWERPRDFASGVVDERTERVVKIQSAFRGKHARDETKRLAGSSQVGPFTPPQVVEIDAHRLEAAAIVIQCAARKYKASRRVEIRKARLHTLTDVGVIDQKLRELRQAINELEAEIEARVLVAPGEEEQFPHLGGLVASWESALATTKEHFLALSQQVEHISTADTVAARIASAEQCHEAIAGVRSECVALLRSVLLMNSYFVELDVQRVNRACESLVKWKTHDLCALTDPRMLKIVQMDDLHDFFAQAETSLQRAVGLTDFNKAATVASGKRFEEFHPLVRAALTSVRELEQRMAHKVELLHVYRNRQQLKQETTAMEREDSLSSQIQRAQRQHLVDQEERAKFLKKCRESWQRGLGQRRDDIRLSQTKENELQQEEVSRRVNMEKMKALEVEQRKKAKLSIWEAVKAGRPVDVIRAMVFAEMQKARRHGYEFDIKSARSRHGETLIQIACWSGHEALVSFFIEEGANVHVVDSRLNSFSLLHDAARRGHTRVIRLLLEHGLQFDVRDASGDTPLHWAARRNHYDAVLTLLGGHLHPLDDQTSADIMRAVKCRNKRGKSPYSVAKSETVRRVIKLAEGGQLPRVRPSWSAPSSPVYASDAAGRRRTILGQQKLAGLQGADTKRILLKSKTAVNFRIDVDGSNSRSGQPSSFVGGDYGTNAGTSPGTSSIM